MGSLSKESFDQFLDSLKLAGIEISNEIELRERLAEAQRWRFAFATLAANGGPLGIRFQNRGTGIKKADINRVFSHFQLPEVVQTKFTASLSAEQ